MTVVTLGNTGITVQKNGFGALPVQRVSREEAAGLLRRAYEGGMQFFDTARAYSDSEEKLHAAFCTPEYNVRNKLYIATKTAATTPEEFWADLKISLEYLGYIDVYQFHNPAFCPRPGDGSGLYEAMLEAKAKGYIRHIGLTNHRIGVAMEAAESGLYETIQFPFSYLSTQKEQDLVKLCAEKNLGYLAMKGLAGGLITNSRAAYAYMADYPNVLPIWGIQRERELDEWLQYVNDPPVMDEELAQLIRKDRDQLLGEFCRGCGYCMPCPMGISIRDCARMSLMIRRAPSSDWMGEYGQGLMAKVSDCIHCGQCSAKCPYGLDTPRLLQENLKDFNELLAGKPL